MNSILVPSQSVSVKRHALFSQVIGFLLLLLLVPLPFSYAALSIKHGAVFFVISVALLSGY